MTLSPAEQADAGAALAAYRQAWADMAAVQDEGNYKDPRLEKHLTGNLLLTVSEALYASEQAGIASRGAPVLSPRVAAVHANASPPTVIIDDCIDPRPSVQYYKATGKIYGTAATSDIADTATMTLVNGTWMMSANDEEYGTPCTP